MAGMTKQQIDAIHRKTAPELLAGAADRRLLKAVKAELTYEWWRGYWAAKSGTAELTPEG